MKLLQTLVLGPLGPDLPILNPKPFGPNLATLLPTTLNAKPELRGLKAPKPLHSKPLNPKPLQYPYGAL